MILAGRARRWQWRWRSPAFGRRRRLRRTGAGSTLKPVAAATTIRTTAATTSRSEPMPRSGRRLWAAGLLGAAVALGACKSPKHDEPGAASGAGTAADSSERARRGVGPGRRRGHVASRAPAARSARTPDPGWAELALRCAARSRTTHRRCVRFRSSRRWRVGGGAAGLARGARRGTAHERSELVARLSTRTAAAFRACHRGQGRVPRTRETSP